MQVPLADGQSKILGTLEVNWNINLITRNKGIRKQEILLLEFCKNDPRILRPLQITFSRWNQIQIWLQEISGYNKKIVPFVILILDPRETHPCPI